MCQSLDGNLLHIKGGKPFVAGDRYLNLADDYKGPKGKAEAPSSSCPCRFKRAKKAFSYPADNASLLGLMQAPKLFEKIVLVNPASSLHRVPWLNLGSQLFLVTEFIYDRSAFLSLPFLAPINRLSSQ